MSRPNLRHVVLGGLAGLCALALAPAPARAGTYKMYSCEPPGLNIAVPTLAPWRIYQINAPTTINTTSCGHLRGGVMQLGFQRSGAYGIMPAVSYAGFELPATEVNPQVGIVRVKSWVAADLRYQGYEPGTLQKPYGDNLNPALMGAPGGVDMVAGYWSAARNPPAAKHKLGVVCGNGAAGRPCQLIGTSTLAVTAAEAELAESTEPAASITGGVMQTPGRKTGQVVLSYKASDGASGIERVEVLLDDVVAGGHDFSRNLALPLHEQGGECTYTGIAACPTTQSRELVVDTAKAPDGVRAVTLRVTDAAHNVTNVVGNEILLDNRQGAGTGEPNGANASRKARLTVRYAKAGMTRRFLRYSARPLVRGRLRNSAKRNIAGARIAVLARNRSAGARERQIGSVTTKANGTFSYRLRPGPSRKITFAYTPFSGDPEPDATAFVRATVRAKLTAYADRQARVGPPWTISGRLLLLPRANVRIFVFGLDRGKWKPVGKGRTGSGGRYNWSYPFSSRARGKTYAFRVQVDSETYPFAPGVSSVVYVDVR